MKRKSFLILVVALFALITAFAFVACDEESGSGSGTGDRIFTEDATYDEISTALQNAESVTIEMYTDGILGQYMITNSSRRIYDGYFDEYDYVYSANGYYYFAGDNDNYSKKFYDMYIDTCDFAISIRTWHHILFETFFMADKNGKITLYSYGESFSITDYSIKMLGDRMEVTWTEEYENEAGQVVRREITYICRAVNSTSFDIPKGIRAKEADAEWYEQIEYNGNRYRLMEDEDGSEYYVVDGGYGDYYGPVEETINGLPVRRRISL